jgi:hypothetical protein
MPLPFVMPALAPVAAIARGVVDALAKLRVSVNGLALAGLVVVMACGGWWIARKARATAIADRIAAETRVTAAINGQLRDWIAHKRGDLALDDTRVRTIRGELRALLEALPPDVVTTYVPVTAPLVVPVPTVMPAASAAPPRAPSATEGGCAVYPDDVRAKLNEINVRRP